MSSSIETASSGGRLMIPRHDVLDPDVVRSLVEGQC